MYDIIAMKMTRHNMRHADNEITCS